MDKFVMNKFYLLAIMLSSSYANAAAQVNYLNIDGDAVHFSIAESKTETSPSCVVAETNERFAFSLKTDAGRAMYSLLITAMAAKQDLAVESAQDCADVAGIERADGISITPTVTSANAESSASKQFYLYTGDGQKKLGRIASLDSYRQFYYLANDDVSTFSFYEKALGTLYFSQDNCQGEAFAINVDTAQHIDGYNNNMYYKSTSDYSVVEKKSYLSTKGCIATSGSKGMYTIELSYVDPLCGESPCQIKEE